MAGLSCRGGVREHWVVLPDGCGERPHMLTVDIERDPLVRLALEGLVEGHRRTVADRFDN
jgi:hypothetical protein